MVCRKKEALIRAAFGALIGADPGNKGSANQRFLLSGKVIHVKLNDYPPLCWQRMEDVMTERLALALIPGVGWSAREIQMLAREAEDAG